MTEEQTLRIKMNTKVQKEDISEVGTVRTSDKGLVAYLCEKGYTPDFLYTQEDRPKWIYFCFNIKDENLARHLVLNYYGGEDTVDAFAFSEWIETAFDWISTFKRNYPQGGRWDREKVVFDVRD